MKMLPMTEIRGLTPEEFRKLVKEGCAIERRALNATETHKQSFPAMGKLVCRAEEDLNLLKSDRDENGQAKKRQVPANTTLSEYWKLSVVMDKDAKLNSHWLSCAVAFGTFVRCDLVTEADYDKNTAECLELAASISTACAHDVTHDAVLKAADELKDRSKDTRKNLRGILESVKGAKPITVEKAREMITAILAANPYFLTEIVIPAIGAEIAHIADTTIARDAYLGLDTAIGLFKQNANVTDAMIDGWLNPAQKPAETGVQHLRAGTPVPA